MLKEKKYHFFVLFLLLSSYQLQAQLLETGNLFPDSALVKPAMSYQVGDISIIGNKKTKATIILRELPFGTGDTYTMPEFVKKMETARRLLMNTSLFHSVVVAAKDFEGEKVNVVVIVKERWYIFPMPVFKPADRNLNQWLFEKDAKLNRVNYGIKVMVNNVTGVNDKFRLSLISGYTKQLSFSYDRLYFDKNMHWGLNTRFAYGKNREINYNTIGDKQVFLKDNSYVRNFINTSIGLSYRPAIRTRHRFGISFTSEEVSDTVVALNPDYFKSGRNRICFPGLFYIMEYYDLDYIPYPTNGYAGRFSISKSGFNSKINLWELHAKASAYWPLSPRSFFELDGYAGIKLPFKQPYFNRRFLGYDDTFLQGYEYFVFDGVAGGYLKTTWAHQLLNFNVRIPGAKKRKMDRIPFRIYGKLYGNAGYVHNPEPGENELSNKMLYSGGIGIDILTLYDVTIKLEWSFNQLGQNGLFLHRKTIF